MVLLETIREYALERLDASEEAEGLWQRLYPRASLAQTHQVSTVLQWHNRCRISRTWRAATGPTSCTSMISPSAHAKRSSMLRRSTLSPGEARRSRRTSECRGNRRTCCDPSQPSPTTTSRSVSVSIPPRIGVLNSLDIARLPVASLPAPPSPHARRRYPRLHAPGRRGQLRRSPGYILHWRSRGPARR